MADESIPADAREAGEEREGKFVKCVTAFMPARFMFTLQAAVSFAIIYMMRVNLSVAIVVMVNHTAIQSNDTERKDSGCPTPPDAKLEDGPFEWGEKLQGHMLGSYFYGYLVSQIPGAVLAERYSGAWVIFGAVASNVLGCALTPPACYAHWSLVIVLRVLQGLGAGVTFPAMHCLMAHWIPPSERSVICAIAYAGTDLGTVVSTLTSGYIAKYVSWQWAFYVLALVCVPWLVTWATFVADSPERSKFIREKELLFIREAIGETINGEARQPFPCREVLKSKPFWAIAVAHLLGSCGFYLVLILLPKFMKQVLHKNIEENVLASCLPFFLLWLLCVFMGLVFDRLIKKGRMKPFTARRIASGVTFLIPAGCLVGISFTGCNDLAGTIIMIIGVTAMGAMAIAHITNHIDIAPNFAGRLMAITNSIATLPGIVMPMLVGMLVDEEPTLRRWSIAFYLVAALDVLAFVLYFFLGSATVQPWNDGPTAKPPAAVVSADN